MGIFAKRGFDITPSGTDLTVPTKGITVSVACTITGILKDDTVSHTTHTLNPGIIHPLAFKRITAVSNGASVKGYA